MGESGEPLLFLRQRFLRFRAFELIAPLCPLRMSEVMTVAGRPGEVIVLMLEREASQTRLCHPPTWGKIEGKNGGRPHVKKDAGSDR